MKENKNILTPEDIVWKFVSSLGMTTYHHTVYICKEYGLQMEIITKKKGECDFGSAKHYYYINGCEREFTDSQTLCDVWNELHDYDDPDGEITWVKVIKKKNK